MRSFFDKPGLRYSSFATIRPGSPRVSRDNSTKGVWPIASTAEGSKLLSRDAVVILNLHHCGNVPRRQASRTSGQEIQQVGCFLRFSSVVPLLTAWRVLQTVPLVVRQWPCTTRLLT